MADVPLAVAIISTVSPVAAGALPLIVGWIKDAGRDKRDAAERLAAERMRLAQEKRGECVKLLRQARDFRVLVENAHDARGADLAAYARQLRQGAADITGQADEVGFMVIATETAASSLASEARALADMVADSKNTAYGAPLLTPDFARFDQCLATFRAAAQAALSDQFAIDGSGATSGGSGVTGSADAVAGEERPGLDAPAGGASEPTGRGL